MAPAAGRKRAASEAQQTAAKRAKVRKTRGAPPPPPPDPAAVLNHPPTQNLDVLVCGNGENGELGLGPGRREAHVPRVNSFLFAGALPPALQQQVLAAAAGAISVVQLACGGMHTVALAAANQLVTWGVNDNGALGRPTAWEGGLRDMDAGGDRSDAESEDAESEGALNPLESTPTPIPSSLFPPGTTFVQVAAGDSCSLALTDTGLVYGWGTCKTTNGDKMFCHDYDGRLVEQQNTPVLIHGLSRITQIACGAHHAMALDAGGVVWTWGSAEQNQLGYRPGLRGSPARAADSLTPHPVGIRHVRDIATGEYHAFAVDRRGDVWGWGFNGFGETGAAPAAAGQPGAPLLLPAPARVHALRGQGVVRLAGGAHHSAAVTADGRCLVWGRLDGGQLGVAFSAEQLADPTLIRHDERGRPRICLRPVAVAAADASAWEFVACGTDHTLFVDAAGAAYATGFNAQGQLGTGTEDDVDGAQRIGGKSIAKRRITWAGAGGQFSVVAGPHVPAES